MKNATAWKVAWETKEAVAHLVATFSVQFLIQIAGQLDISQSSVFRILNAQSYPPSCCDPSM
jgi:hypothetical protein